MIMCIQCVLADRSAPKRTDHEVMRSTCGYSDIYCVFSFIFIVYSLCIYCVFVCVERTNHEVMRRTCSHFFIYRVSFVHFVCFYCVFIVYLLCVCVCVCEQNEQRSHAEHQYDNVFLLCMRACVWEPGLNGVCIEYACTCVK
jgi:hypothetical protein